MRGLLSYKLAYMFVNYRTYDGEDTSTRGVIRESQMTELKRGLIDFMLITDGLSCMIVIRLTIFLLLLSIMLW